MRLERMELTFVLENHSCAVEGVVVFADFV